MVTDVAMKVSNPKDPSLARQLIFLVDSGAIYSVVPRRILTEIGVVPDSVEWFSLADLTQIERDVGQAAFTHRGRTRVLPVMFGEEGDATLLGVMTLEALGLVLDPVRREIRPMAMRL